jgi:hypothetical protein
MSSSSSKFAVLCVVVAGAVGGAWAWAQDDAQGPETTPRPTAQQEPTHRLPEAWHGVWTGRAVLIGPEGERVRFPMSLRIEPLDDPGAAPGALSWELVYNEGELRQVRGYTIAPVTQAPGRFRIDEGNGIAIEATLFADDILYSSFDVQGSRLTTRHALRGDGTMVMEIVSSRDAQALTTGGGEVETPDGMFPIPEVVAHRPGTLQRAVLTRQTKPAGESDPE